MKKTKTSKLKKKKKPLYSKKACAMIDNICICEKPKAKVVKSGKEFSKYIKNVTK